MEPVTLTRDVNLDLPVDDLWSLVADPEGLGLWLGDSVDLDVQPGGTGVVRDDDSAGTVIRHVRVDRVEPVHELAFTWWRDDDPGAASHVVFRLTPVPGGSHLHITETLPPLPSASLTATALACTARIAWEVRAISLWACAAATATALV